MTGCKLGTPVEAHHIGVDQRGGKSGYFLAANGLMLAISSFRASSGLEELSSTRADFDKPCDNAAVTLNKPSSALLAPLDEAGTALISSTLSRCRPQNRSTIP